MFTERQEGGAQIESQVNGLRQCVAALGELRQGIERLLKIRHGFTIRRAGYCPNPSLPTVCHGLVPYLAPPHGVVG
jgi:hypothetical protein